MRTYKVLTAAAVLAVSVATSMAQPYSVNIVGYVNLTLNPGFNLVANQFDSSAGSNSLNAVFPNSVDGDSVYKYSGGTFSIAISDTGSWVDSISGLPSSMTVNPGDGIFFFSANGTPRVATLVGSVRTGTNTVNMGSGFSLISSVTPESYELTGTNFPASDGFTHYKYNSGVFVQSIFDTGAWVDSITGLPSTVKPNVGEGFFMFNPGAPVNWTRTFNP